MNANATRNRFLQYGISESAKYWENFQVIQVNLMVQIISVIISNLIASATAGLSPLLKLKSLVNIPAILSTSVDVLQNTCRNKIKIIEYSKYSLLSPPLVSTFLGVKLVNIYCIHVTHSSCKIVTHSSCIRHFDRWLHIFFYNVLIVWCAAQIERGKMDKQIYVLT